MSSHRVYGQNLRSRIAECRNEEELQVLMSRVVKAHGEGLISDGTMRKLHQTALKVRGNLRASLISLPPGRLLVPRGRTAGGLIMPS